MFGFGIIVVIFVLRLFFVCLWYFFPLVVRPLFLLFVSGVLIEDVLCLLLESFDKIFYNLLVEVSLSSLFDFLLLVHRTFLILFSFLLCPFFLNVS